MYSTTTIQDLINACSEPDNNWALASTGAFLDTLIVNEKLTHAVQWLFRTRSLHELTDYIAELLNVDDLNTFNTYNWGSNCTNDLQGFDFTYKGNDYCAIQVHRGGDIRCNYSDFVVVEGSFIDNVQDYYADSIYIEVDGHDIAVSPSLTSEWVELYDQTDGTELESVAMVYIDDIKEAVREQLKELA